MRRRRRLFTKLTVAAAVLGGALPAREAGADAAPPGPQDPIVTDRPDFTESAETVPAGRTQVEGGVTFRRNGADEELAVGELLLRVATGARTELRVNVGSHLSARGTAGRQTGREDVALGFKVKLGDASRRFGLGAPGVALLGEASLPTGARAFRENVVQPEVKLCLAWALSERVALSSNLNYAHRREEGEWFGEPSGSVSVGYSLAERTGAYLELFGFAPPGKGRPNTSYLNGGVSYLVTNDYQLDARAGVGLNGKTNDYFLGGGASRRW